MTELTPTNPSNKHPSLRDLASTSGLNGTQTQSDMNYNAAVQELRAAKGSKPNFPPS